MAVTAAAAGAARAGTARCARKRSIAAACRNGRTTSGSRRTCSLRPRQVLLLGRLGRGGGKWATDYPDSDFNFSYRLHELTALETDPYGKILELTDDALFDYPWLYMIEPGDMYLEEAEVLALRKYLLNGGFMMVDDFWGEDEWQNFYENIKRVFPDREPRSCRWSTTSSTASMT